MNILSTTKKLDTEVESDFERALQLIQNGIDQSYDTKIPDFRQALEETYTDNEPTFQFEISDFDMNVLPELFQ